MKRQSNRREFLKQTTLAGVGFWVAGGIAPAASKSPNEKLNIACIGVGGKGSSDTDQAGHQGNIVALCDIDEHTLNGKGERYPNAKKYYDFRKMLEEMDKSIDAVTVSTPDHTHAPASIMAMRMGKHVYCQKPLTHDPYEARMMREIAAQYKVATQMGNQGTAENGLRRAVEIIQAGVIGHVKEAHVWTNRPIWPQAPSIIKRPPESPVPSHVHWDEFIGPAPMRPYADYDETATDRRTGEKRVVKKGYYHPFAWRGWWDFGTGALGDMACHTANMAFMALKLNLPISVVAESGEINPETYPAWAMIHYDFPARGEMPPVRLTWYEGRREGKKVLPPEDLIQKAIALDTNPRHKDKLVESGSILVGDKGIIYSPDDYGARFFLHPAKDFEGLNKTQPEHLPPNGHGDNGMKAEWIAACKGGPPAMSSFDYASRLTETMLLGNVAMRVGKRIEYDGQSGQVTNCAEAAQYVKREYRNGWTL